jgi:hypothetical protein
VLEEPLGVGQLVTLRPDPAETFGDHSGPVGCTPPEHQPDLRQAHADALAGPDDLQATDVFLGVLPVTGRRSIGDDDPRVVPVPQHVDLDADPPSCCTDPHRAPFVPLDLRST